MNGSKGQKIAWPFAALAIPLRHGLTVAILCVSSLSVAAPPVQQASALIDVAGTQIAVPYQVALEATAESEQTQLTATVSVPLDALLAALQHALDQQRPRNNCAKHGENLVLDTPQLALALYQSQLRLIAHANAEVWGCVDLFGQDVKTRLLEGAIRAQILGNWVVEPNALQLKLDLENVDADGNLGEVARVFTELTGESLVQTLRRELQRQSLPPLPLPQALMKLGGHFDAARFVERHGQIEAEIVIRASDRWPTSACAPVACVSVRPGLLRSRLSLRRAQRKHLFPRFAGLACARGNCLGVLAVAAYCVECGDAAHGAAITAQHIASDSALACLESSAYCSAARRSPIPAAAYAASGRDRPPGFGRASHAHREPAYPSAGSLPT